MSPLGLTISQIHNMKLCGYEKKMRLVYMEWYGKMSIVRGEKWLASKVCVYICVYIYVYAYVCIQKNVRKVIPQISNLMITWGVISEEMMARKRQDRGFYFSNIYVKINNKTNRNTESKIKTANFVSVPIPRIQAKAHSLQRCQINTNFSQQQLLWQG